MNSPTEDKAAPCQAAAGNARTPQDYLAPAPPSSAGHRRVDANDSPLAGAGVHPWILATGNRCRSAGLSEADAVLFIRSRMTRPPKPANEVEVAVRKAYSEQGRPVAKLSWTQRPPQSSCRAPVSVTSIKFDPNKLANIAGQITAPANWRHWLWERSPKRPEAMNAFSFLSHLYAPGEIVLVFDVFERKRPLLGVDITSPMDCTVPSLVRRGGRYGSGIWFLCNPVSGEWHPNPRQDNSLSCRSEESVTSFRYGVLESDQAPAAQWLAFLVQLPVRISAIYPSGSRSIHALLRLDAGSKAEWDSIIAPLKRPLRVLGGDHGALSAVRLSRLPHCQRPEKNGFQRLLYLCPNPPAVPLVDLPVLFSRSDTLTRWRQVCPRWNPGKEAFA